jgi:hypothetical protein
MSEIIRVKKINFYHVIDNRINSTVNSYSGHGSGIFFDNQFFTGVIVNPTGLQPAVYFTTGLLTGYIQDGSGFYNWENLQLTGIGESGQVYLNYITGQKPAENIIEFITSNGEGLENGDYINIQDFLFYYNNNPTNPIQFNSPSNLINNLNSGATGAFNQQGYALLESFVGITGYQIDNKLFLFSYLREGENGNTIRVSRESNNLNSIKIHSRYFTGGESYRPKIDSWEGSFSETFNLTAENSGFYSKQIDPIVLFSNISGLLWEDNFTGNYKIFTGFKDPRNPQDYSGIQLLFNNEIDQFSGIVVIPSNQSTIYTGLNIEILKPNPYNILGNRFEYIISGNEIFYKDILEG